MNAGTPHWRRNIFWMLLAMSCTLWMTGQFEWTYYEVYLHQVSAQSSTPATSFSFCAAFR